MNSIGTERRPTAATASASNVFWLGCAVDTLCGSVAFTLDLPAAADREPCLDVRKLLLFFPLLGLPTAAHRGTLLGSVCVA